MKSGALDQRIILHKQTITRGANGEEIASWAAWKTVWAAVKTSSGNERVNGPQLVAEATHKIMIRYLSGVEPVMRVNWRGKDLDIIFVDESRRRQGEMNLFCKEAGIT